MTPRDQVFADIISELRINGQATIRGFGTFKVKAMNGRTARNPRTGEAVEVPPHNKLTFKPPRHSRRRSDMVVNFRYSPTRAMSVFDGSSDPFCVSFHWEENDDAMINYAIKDGYLEKFQGEVAAIEETFTEDHPAHPAMKVIIPAIDVAALKYASAIYAKKQAEETLRHIEKSIKHHYEQVTLLFRAVGVMSDYVDTKDK